MQPLVALLAATAACALARPPDAIMGVGRRHLQPTDGDAIFKRMILTRYFFVDPRPHPHLPPQLPMLPFDYDSRYDWLNKEIERLNIMNTGDPTDRSSGEKTLGSFEYVSSGFPGRETDKMANLWGYKHEALPELTVPPSSIAPKSQSPKSYNGSERRTREAFALTPFDNGYYDTDENHYQHGHSYNDYAPYEQIMRRRKSSKDVLLGKRPIRQNPNRKNKLLISEHLDKMKSGLSNLKDRIVFISTKAGAEASAGPGIGSRSGPGSRERERILGGSASSAIVNGNENGIDVGDKNSSVKFTPALGMGYRVGQERNAEQQSKAYNRYFDMLVCRPGKDYRIPVSLVPANLQWLKLKERPPDTESQTDTARRVFVAETIKPDPTSSLYGVALVAAVAIALTITLIGFALGWYMISKKAKAAADVDYPAYGVTGPTLDCSGDRKLAHSAHMYHYQHQKQQILAMERNGVDQRIGSVSDPESEEENEEGDYTVYECPGFATTGDMEVKNPLFSDDPTPATPGKDAAKKDEKVNMQYKDTKE